MFSSFSPQRLSYFCFSSGGFEKILEKCAEGMFYGAIPPCPSCKKGMKKTNEKKREEKNRDKVQKEKEKRRGKIAGENEKGGMRRGAPR